MNPGQNGSAQASIDLEKKWTGEVQIEVDVAVSPDSFVLCSAATNEPGFDVNDICKPLLFQQIAYHVHRRDADARALRESDRCDFWRRIGLFGPEPSGNAPKQRRGGGGAAQRATTPANSKWRRFVCIGPSSKNLSGTFRGPNVGPT